MEQPATRSALEVSDLVKDYPLAKGWHRAVAGVSFTIEEGHFYSLLGPSGCGKTTTLRCVAGLERPDGGRIVLGGVTVADAGSSVPPEKRDIGMVFQSYAIWPHMTVIENVAFPLRVGSTKVSRADITRRVGDALDLVQLGSYASRPATQLSGGQQQRLALARALVRRPRLLLLDEPLSNLDAKLRDRMRAEIRDLQRSLGITTLYVTHDQVEALSMSNRIAVMEDGLIVQEGTPREIYSHPTSRFVANFVGAANFLPATVSGPGAGAGRMLLRVGDGTIEASVPAGVVAGDAVTLSIRPEAVRFHTSAPGGPNVLAGEVEQALFLGDAIDLRVTVAAGSVAVRLPSAIETSRGDRVWLELDAAEGGDPSAAGPASPA